MGDENHGKDRSSPPPFFFFFFFFLFLVLFHSGVCIRLVVKIVFTFQHSGL